MLKGAYIKVIAVHGLIVQRDCYSDADVCFSLDGGWRDDEMVGVVAHQVHLKHAVQTLGRSEKKKKTVGKGAEGRRSGAGARIQKQMVLEGEASNTAL